MRLMIQPQKSNRRDKFNIVLTILDITRTPVRKTHIMYKAELNFYQLTRYINWLTTVGMIEEIESTFKGYKITAKGLQLFNLFESGAIASLNEKQLVYQLVEAGA